MGSQKEEKKQKNNQIHRGNGLAKRGKKQKTINASHSM